MRRIAISWLMLCGALFAAWQKQTPAVASCDNMLGVFNCKTPASGGGTTTFDPAHTDVNLSLSGGNLIVSLGTGGGPYVNTRTIASHSSGKIYNEFVDTNDGGNSNSVCVGLLNSSQVTNNYLGSSSNSVGYFGGGGGSGTVSINGSTVATIQGYAQGNTISMAEDTAAQLVWFGVNGGIWNNSGSANPATGVGGISIASVTGPYFGGVCENGSGAGFVMTGNFGAASPGYTYFTAYGSQLSGYGNF
jgi:hypothetical protein